MFDIISEEGPISDAEDEPTFGQVVVNIYNFKKLNQDFRRAVGR